MPALIAHDGPLEGSRFDFDDELTIGREGQGLTVDDPSVSRSHAVVRSTGESVTVEDLGSLNGTFVNGERIRATTTLAHGDVVTIGAMSFEFEGPPLSGATVAMPTPHGATAAMPAPRVEVPDVPQSAAPALARVEAPDLPFGAYGAGSVAGRSRRKIASRQLLPELISIVAVCATAVALILYFALR